MLLEQIFSSNFHIRPHEKMGIGLFAFSKLFPTDVCLSACVESGLCRERREEGRKEFKL